MGACCSKEEDKNKKLNIKPEQITKEPEIKKQKVTILHK
jgi:hypothetical protein